VAPTDATQATVASPSAATAVTPMGAIGISSGTTTALGADAGDVPAEFVAFTVKVYGVPSIKEGTEQAKKVVVQVNPPGLEVTVYEVAPTEATQATVAEPSPATAVTPLGAAGIGAAADGVTAELDTEGAELPEVFVATTANVYGVPLLNPNTEQDTMTVVQVNPPGLEVTV
jgi:hypothetical protein